jgi:hypothetical protein
MKMAILKRTPASSVAVLIFLYAISDVRAHSHSSIGVNQNAFAFAVQLIKEGHFIVDGKGAWSEHRPSADEENEFIRVHGFAEYAKWHLAIDSRFAENTKRRYKFPYGDFKNVHRCALLAVKARARQHGHAEIQSAAAELERAIKDKPPINTDLHRLKNSSLSHLCISVALTCQAVKNALINSGNSSL